MKNLIIRADSSTEIGTGHLMRIKTLMHQIRKQNENKKGYHRDSIQFHIVSYPFEGHCLNIFDQEDTCIHFLPYNQSDSSDYRYVKEHMEQDILYVNNLIIKLNAPLVLIDHYMLSDNYEIQMDKRAKVFVIDDFPNRQHQCDVLLNQNYSESVSKLNEISIVHKKLLGPNYAILRDEFLAIEHIHKSQKISDVFVSFGGTDPTNEMKKTINMIEAYKWHIHFHLVVGQNYYLRNKSLLDTINNENMTLYVQIDNISQVMNKCQIAIGAGGSSALERMYMNLVSLTISVASNQVGLSIAMHNNHLGIHLGNAQEVTVEKMYHHLNKLINDDTLFSNYQNRLRHVMNKSIVKKCEFSNEIIKALEVDAYEKKH